MNTDYELDSHFYRFLRGWDRAIKSCIMQVLNVAVSSLIGGMSVWQSFMAVMVLAPTGSESFKEVGKRGDDFTRSRAVLKPNGNLMAEKWIQDGGTKTVLLWMATWGLRSVLRLPCLKWPMLKQKVSLFWCHFSHPAILYYECGSIFRSLICRLEEWPFCVMYFCFLATSQ